MRRVRESEVEGKKGIPAKEREGSGVKDYDQYYSTTLQEQAVVVNVGWVGVIKANGGVKGGGVGGSNKAETEAAVNSNREKTAVAELSWFSWFDGWLNSWLVVGWERERKKTRKGILRSKWQEDWLSQ